MRKSEIIAELLLREGAVYLNTKEPFTWTSGLKAPVYCDNRLLISSVQSRKLIINAFVEEIGSLNINLIAGTATAGIPWASWIAHEMDLPLVYVRSSAKEHGRKNAIEGKLQEGARAVLIEDLVSTGKSSLSAANKLRNENVHLETIMSIFSYQFPHNQMLFSSHQLNLIPLTNIEVLAQVAFTHKMVNREDLKEVLSWRESVRFE